jgi:hypothetical protein
MRRIFIKSFENRQIKRGSGLSQSGVSSYECAGNTPPVSEFLICQNFFVQSNGEKLPTLHKKQKYRKIGLNYPLSTVNYRLFISFLLKISE